jgi:hypothetical protein
MLKFPTMRIYDEARVMGDLPSGLKRTLQFELFKDVLELSPFFYGVNKDVHKQICTYVHSNAEDLHICPLKSTMVHTHMSICG